MVNTISDCQSLKECLRSKYKLVEELKIITH